jgi:phenylalanyl-tRNA synthetase beta chain
MKFSYNFLQTFFEKKLPRPEKLSQLLTMHVFEVKDLEKLEKDFVFDIDVLPNRSDCFSHLGIAREISAILGLKMKMPEINIKEEKDLRVSEFLKVKVENFNDCQRYTARVVFDVKVGPSPSWLCSILKSCGLKPINNIVDITNYVMLETGQPLHAFDFDKISGNQVKKIVVKRAKKGEKIISLDGEEYELDSEILVITDQKNALAIAGIKGGKKAEIDEKTKRIVLESANFNPKRIRLGSRKIDLKTDASLRFEHGIDPNLTEFAIDRAVTLIQKISKGKVLRGKIDFYPNKVLPKRILFKFEKLNNFLSINISPNKAIKILQKLGMKVLSDKQGKFLIEIPTFRQDLSLEEDLVEEIGRIYGLEKIPAILPTTLLIPAKKNLDVFWEERTKNILKEAGMNEVYTYSFINQKDKAIFKFKELVEIENPVSAEFSYLRPSLIPNILKAVEKNQRFFKEIKIFEIGKIFPGLEKKEKKMLTGAITGDAFFEAKGIVDYLFQKLGIPKVWYDEFQPTPEDSQSSVWHLKKSAEIKVDNEEIGFLGEISPKIISALSLKDRVVVFDLDFEKIINLASEEVIYQPVSPFPPVIRDISILVPNYVLVGEVLDKIENTGGELLIDVDLFDIFEGENLPEGKKSLSFHLIFQAKDRVLSSKEVNEIQQKIIQALENEGWEVRK